MPLFGERCNRVLIALYKNMKIDTAKIRMDLPSLPAIAYSSQPGLPLPISEYLQEEGYVKQIGAEHRMTGKGIRHVEELRAGNQDATQAFVAMWFSEEARVIYDKAIAPGIMMSGFDPVLLSDMEHSNDVNDEIVGQIRKSRFVVADFSGHRHGVYFEAGFAMGLNIPVILTCRIEEENEIHFDLRQFNFILWSDEEELRRRLLQRIQAVVGQGSLRAEADR